MDLTYTPYHVKSPVDVQATNAVRTVSSVTTVGGPKLSRALRGLLRELSELRVATKPYGAHTHTTSDPSKQLALIICQKPTIYDYGCIAVTASLANPNPIDDRAAVDSYLKWVENEIILDHIKHFITIYTRTLVTPLIAYIRNHSVAFETHM